RAGRVQESGEVRAGRASRRTSWGWGPTVRGERKKIEKETRMPVTVRIPTPLRQVTKGNAEVQTKAGTVDDVVADLERQFPGLRERLVDDSGELRRFINIYVNEEDIRFMDGRKTTLKDGDAVSIVPAIAGG